MDELERKLFVYPGSVQEIVEKVRAQISDRSDNPVFNWFSLAGGKHPLPRSPKGVRKTPRKVRSYIAPDGQKWSSLKLTGRGPLLPAVVRGNAHYMRQVREMCVLWALEIGVLEHLNRLLTR